LYRYIGFKLKAAGLRKQKKPNKVESSFYFRIRFFIMVLIFKAINDKLIIDFILKFAGVTYGPLLDYLLWILTKRK